MRSSHLLHVLISVLILFSTISAFAESENIRVRIFKDLSEFPVVKKARVRLISNRVWSIEGQRLQFQNKELASINYVLKKDSGRFDVISVLNFNSYLAGVISKEMPLGWPLEALKTQAVVARSFALARMNERKNKVFHLDSDQMDQVYAYTDSVKAIQAVALTDRIVLKDQNGKVLKAFYHSDCGGQTIPASKVWSDAKDTGTALDPWCAERASNAWSAKISKKEFLQKLELPDEASLQIQDSYRSRIQGFTFLGDAFSVQKLRQVFGFSFIRNSPMSYSETETEIIFRGKGYGHGAGLCQWGTQAQAKRGRGFLQILEHYFPEAQITRESLRLSKNFLSDLVFN